MDTLLLRIEDAARRLSLGRSKTYELVQSGDLPVVRIGKAVRIPVAGLERWVERQASIPDGEVRSAQAV